MFAKHSFKNGLKLFWFKGDVEPSTNSAPDQCFTIDRVQMAFLLKSLEVATKDPEGSQSSTHLPSWLEGFSCGLHMSKRHEEGSASDRNTALPGSEKHLHPSHSQPSDFLSQTFIAPVVGLDSTTIGDGLGAVKVSGPERQA